MSFQKEAESTANGDHEQQEAETPQVSWFRKSFPHYFSPKVVAARGQAHNPLPESKDKEVVVTRKLSEKRTTYATLQRDGDTYFLKLGCGRKLPVPRYMLQNAAGSANSIDWVRIKIGDEVLRLKRAELHSAFNTLEST